MPFITEELWQMVAPLAGIEGDTIMHQPYPAKDDSKLDVAAENELEWVKSFVSGVRKIRSERDLAPGKPLAVLIQNASDDDRSCFDNNRNFIETLAKLESVDWLDTSSDVPESAMALVGEMKILVPLAGIIDKDAELARLEKEIGKLQVNIDKTEAKLNNKGFTDKAPEAVVEKERQRLDELKKTMAQLLAQQERIKAL
jgi:valyl-tRNA synthetase